VFSEDREPIPKHNPEESIGIDKETNTKSEKTRRRKQWNFVINFGPYEIDLTQ